MKGFLFDCTASFGIMHRKNYHIASFAPIISGKSTKFLPFPVQYYRRFLCSKISSKNRWFVPNCCTNQNPHKHWVFAVKVGRHFGKSGLSQNVIETSFRFQKSHHFGCSNITGRETDHLFPNYMHTSSSWRVAIQRSYYSIKIDNR